MLDANLEPNLKPLNCSPSKLPFSTVSGGGETGTGPVRTGPRRYEGSRGTRLPRVICRELSAETYLPRVMCRDLFAHRRSNVTSHIAPHVFVYRKSSPVASQHVAGRMSHRRSQVASAGMNPLRCFQIFALAMGICHGPSKQSMLWAMAMAIPRYIATRKCPTASSALLLLFLWCIGWCSCLLLLLPMSSLLASSSGHCPR